MINFERLKTLERAGGVFNSAIWPYSPSSEDELLPFDQWRELFDDDIPQEVLENYRERAILNYETEKLKKRYKFPRAMEIERLNRRSIFKVQKHLYVVKYIEYETTYGLCSVENEIENVVLLEFKEKTEKEIMKEIKGRYSKIASIHKISRKIKL
ncbi:MAG: hypothetical protein GY679_01655 [Mycoplasma sp.]|nr:hypothetical protein [Mycoplasma sp.]